MEGDTRAASRVRVRGCTMEGRVAIGVRDAQCARACTRGDVGSTEMERDELRMSTHMYSQCEAHMHVVRLLNQ